MSRRPNKHYEPVFPCSILEIKRVPHQRGCSWVVHAWQRVSACEGPTGRSHADRDVTVVREALMAALGQQDTGKEFEDLYPGEGGHIMPRHQRNRWQSSIGSCQYRSQPCDG